MEYHTVVLQCAPRLSTTRTVDSECRHLNFSGRRHTLQQRAYQAVLVPLLRIVSAASGDRWKLHHICSTVARLCHTAPLLLYTKGANELSTYHYRFTITYFTVGQVCSWSTGV